MLSSGLQRAFQQHNNLLFTSAADAHQHSQVNSSDHYGKGTTRIALLPSYDSRVRHLQHGDGWAPICCLQDYTVAWRYTNPSADASVDIPGLGLTMHYEKQLLRIRGFVYSPTDTSLTF